MRRLCVRCREPFDGPVCLTCTKARDNWRGTPAARGYGSRWRANAKRFLAANPLCVLCGMPARVADHWPVPRRDLVGKVPDPDAWHRLRPLCMPCDARHGRQ